MRSKAPLVLMEQTIMVLVFALCAALCLRVFVWSELRSQHNAARDSALLQGENAAELLKGGQGTLPQRLAFAAETLGGSSDGDSLWVTFDENWSPVCDGEGVYRLTAQALSPALSGLAGASVQVVAVDKTETLFSLEVLWQEEVTAHG